MYTNICINILYIHPHIYDITHAVTYTHLQNKRVPCAIEAWFTQGQMVHCSTMFDLQIMPKIYFYQTCICNRWIK